MNATQHARPTTFWSGNSRVSVLEVDFLTRSGETFTFTAPASAASLTTGTRPRKNGLHVAAVSKGVAVCESVGTEFWAIAESPRTYWATSDGQFFMVHYVPQRAIVDVTPVTSWGHTDGPTVSHPATEAIR